MTDESTTTTPPRRLMVKAFGVTDKGKVRTTNEDQFLIAELTKAMRVWQTSLPEPKLQVGEERAHLFLVADGMSSSVKVNTPASGPSRISTFAWVKKLFDEPGTGTIPLS